VLDANMTRRTVPCPKSSKSIYDLRAGKRRSVADKRSLPVFFDGGCSVVHLRFRLSTKTIEEVSCNGRA
jgi:hypothetical protein